MIEALYSYLQSPEWQEYVASFVKSNCEQFRVYSEEFTHEQYATWKNFQEIAEQVLEGALSDMQNIEFGGGMDALERELDKIALEEPTGPRDGILKELLGQLLTFDSFPNFAYMMHTSHKIMERHAATAVVPTATAVNSTAGGGGGGGGGGSGGGGNVHEEMLLSMGFSQELIHLVLESTAPDTPFDDIVGMLSEMGGGQEQPQENRYQNHQNVPVTPQRHTPQVHQTNTVTPSHPPRNDDIEFDDNDDDDDDDIAYINLFAKAIDTDPAVLMAKLVSAKSVVAKPSGQSPHAVDWSTKFVAMMKEAQTCYIFNDLSHGTGYVMPTHVFNEWKVDLPYVINNVSLTEWYTILAQEQATEEHHEAYMRGFAAALNIPMHDLQSNLNLAQDVYQSMVDGTQAAADRPNLCIWAIDFLDMMKIAQDFSDVYEEEVGSQSHSGPITIPSTVFKQYGTDSNGKERKLTDWYRDLEASRTADDDANGALGAVANALQISPYELQKKLECAEEITEAVKSNTFELMGAPKGIKLSNWAAAYQSFLKEAQTCYLHYQLSNENDGGGAGGQVPPHVFEEWVVDVYAVNHVSVNSHGDDATKTTNSIGLLHWYTELEFARIQADSNEAGDENDIFSDEKELARMAELEKIAAMGAEHEQLLHTLITRHDTATKELTSFQQQCDMLCSVASGGMLRREKLEEMYLFLKSNVLSGDDLESVSNAVYEKMSAMDPSGESGGVVDMLLSMHLLEDELIMLKQRIDTILNSDIPSDTGSKESKADYYGMKPVLDEPSGSPFPMASHSSPFTSIGTYQIPDEVCSLQAESKVNAVVNSGSWTEVEDAKAESKAETKVDVEADALRNEAEAAAALRNEAAAASFTQKLKDDHRTGLNTLKAALNKNRAQKLGELKNLRQQQEENGESVFETERRIHILTEELQEEEEGLIKGYKRRCVLETRAVKAKIAQGAPPEDWVLTAEEREQAAQHAVKSLRDKYESDLRKLHESQKHDRSKSKQKLMDKILARKRRQAAEDNFASNVTAEDMLESSEEEAAQMLAEQEAKAQTEMIRPLLLSITAAQLMDPVLVTQVRESDAKGVVDDDDGYFGDNVSGDAQALKLVEESTRQSVEIANSYTGAVGMLPPSRGGGSSLSGGESEGGGVGVVLNACTVHVQDMGNHRVEWGHGKKDDLDMDRIKNGILSEFQKKKLALEQSLAQKQDNSAKLLDERRNKKKKKQNALEYDTSDDTVLEEDVDDLNNLMKEFDNNVNEGPVDFEQKYRKWYSNPVHGNGDDNDKQNPSSAADSKGPSSGAGAIRPMGGGSGYGSVAPKRGFHLAPLDGGGASSVQKILMGKSGGKEPADTKSRVHQWMEQRNQDKDKKNDIMETHNVHQGNLIDGLSHEMAQQKNKLKDRLNHLKAKKRNAAARDSASQSKQDDTAESEKEEEEIKEQEDNLQRLEANYERLVNMLNDASSDDLQKVGLARLKGLLDQSSSSDGTPLTLKNDQDMQLSDLDAWDTAEKRRQELKSSQQNKRKMLHAEAKEISEQYSEENKKLTLKMNLEKARQKQNLQRKLLERKRGAQNSGSESKGI